MGVKVVGDKDNLFCPWIQSVRSVLEYLRKIQCCSGLRHNGFPPACQWLTDHEYICDSVADIHGIHLFRMPRFTWDALFLYKNLYSQALNAVWPGLLPPCRVKKS